MPPIVNQIKRIHNLVHRTWPISHYHLLRYCPVHLLSQEVLVQRHCLLVLRRKLLVPVPNKRTLTARKTACFFLNYAMG